MDKSFLYVLGLLVICLGYSLYKQEQEFDRLFKIATDQKEAILRQQEALEIQRLYIKILERKVKEPQTTPIPIDKLI